MNPEIRRLIEDHSAALEFVRELASWSELGREDGRERDAIILARKWLHDERSQAEPLTTEETATKALTRYCAICYHPLDACSHCDQERR